MKGEAEETRTAWGTYSTCPACGVEDMEYCDYPNGLERDGDMAETMCPHCGKDYMIQVSVEYQFRGVSKPPPAGPGQEGGDG